MNSPLCIDKVDIIIDNEWVKFSKCCLSMEENVIKIPFKDAYLLTDEEIIEFIQNLPSKRPENGVIEMRQNFGCQGSCIDDWSHPATVIGVSTKICNLKCPICRDKIYTSETLYREKELLFRFLNLACQFPKVHTIVPALMGEFFVFKDEAFQFLSNAKKYQKYVFFASNLTLLNDNDITELLSGNYDNVGIHASIDSFNPSIYTRMRRGTSCKDAFQVFRNFSRLAESKSKLNEFTVHPVLFPQINFIKEDIENTLFVFESHKFDDYLFFKASQTPLEEYTKEVWFTEEFQKKIHFSYNS